MKKARSKTLLPRLLTTPWISGVLLCGLLSSAGAQILHSSDPEVEREVEEHFGPGAMAPFRAANGMVSSSSTHATMAGLETLRAGGNAVDAMAVVQFVLNVAEPYASGIGGGLFAVIYEAESGKVISLDGREEAPKKFSPDAFRDEKGKIIPYRERTIGGNSVGVPGTLAATAQLLERYGTLTLAEALQPAIRLAETGFPISETFAGNLKQQWDRLRHYPETMRLFGREDGSPLQAGDSFRNPELAATFSRIAEEGIALFYEGEIGEDILQTIQQDPIHPGVLEREDLANYRPVYREPISVPYRGYEVYGMNMPSSGGATLGLMLNLLEASNSGSLEAGSVETLQRLANVQNLAFADRDYYMGDADFADVPVQGLLDKSYAKKRWQLVPAGKALPTPVSPGHPEGAVERRQAEGQRSESKSTTHFVIVDKARNVVSITSTIEQHFGSGLVVDGRGFLLNNELTDFDAEAFDEKQRLVPNAPEGGWQPRRTALGDSQTEGGKRPRSSMTPTIVLRGGKPVLALGSPGGSRIIGITLNVLVNVLDHGLDVQEAINAPRAIARNGQLEFEAPLYRNSALLDELRARGFQISNAQAVGAAQAVQIGEDGWLYGAADPRREGLAIGY